MKNLHKCRMCGKIFKGYGKRKFCSRSCLGYENLKRIKFSWNDLSPENKLMRLKMSFDKKCIKNDGCWGWNGQILPSGYTQIRFNGKKIMSHRASWILFNGSIPESKWVLHKCDNRVCTNPEHLFLGTPKNNAEDRDKKGRGQSGITHWKSKLCESDVVQIKKLILDGLSCEKISKKFSVTNGAIWFIKRGITWKQVN